MTSIAMSAPVEAGAGVSLFRLYLLRATYLLFILGLGMFTVPELISHEPLSRGVIPSLLGAIWLLAFVGLRYPLQMIPLLLFEFAWKTIWLLDYGLAQWSTGQMPATFPEDFRAIVIGVVLMPVVIPWGYAFGQFPKLAGARWR